MGVLSSDTRLKIAEAIGEVVGQGSVCWSAIEDAGVFQDVRANAFCQRALVRIVEIVEAAPENQRAALQREMQPVEDFRETPEYLALEQAAMDYVDTVRARLPNAAPLAVERD